MTDEAHIRTAERHRIADWLEKQAECGAPREDEDPLVKMWVAGLVAAYRSAAAELRRMST